MILFFKGCLSFGDKIGCVFFFFVVVLFGGC